MRCTAFDVWLLTACRAAARLAVARPRPSR